MLEVAQAGGVTPKMTAEVTGSEPDPAIEPAAVIYCGR